MKISTVDQFLEKWIMSKHNVDPAAQPRKFKQKANEMLSLIFVFVSPVTIKYNWKAGNYPAYVLPHLIIIDRLWQLNADLIADGIITNPETQA